jgi:hypothetical protein
MGGAGRAREVSHLGESTRPSASAATASDRRSISPLGQFLPGWTRHDATHVADMLKALPERRNDPEIVAWLGRPDIAVSISSYQKTIE